MDSPVNSPAIFWDFSRSPASVRLLVEFGCERGLAADTLLIGSGLQRRQLDDPNVELSAAQELCVTGNLLRLSNESGRLGIQVGLRYRFSVYGVWGYGLISSATAADALSLALRFTPLTFAFTTISYHSDQHRSILTFAEPDLEPDLRQFVVERDMAAAMALMRELTGPDTAVTAATFKFPKYKNATDRQEVQAAFGVEPVYRAKANTLVFDSRALNRPLPNANPITAAMCEQLCDQLLQRRRVRTSKADIVRQYLHAPGRTQFDLATIARLTNTSHRTLKRRLQEEGTSFRQLATEARREIAVELLGNGQLTMAEIAERLGFSDPSSFSQAFKRWYGVAPSGYRCQRTRD
jgi:AraC-like DNA-binding protein